MPVDFAREPTKLCSDFPLVLPRNGIRYVRGYPRSVYSGDVNGIAVENFKLVAPFRYSLSSRNELSEIIRYTFNSVSMIL